MYRSGHNEPHSKCGCRATGTWVRIPPSPLGGIQCQIWTPIGSGLTFFLYTEPVSRSVSAAWKKQNSQKLKTKQLKTVRSEPTRPTFVTSRIPSPETLNRAGANSLRLFKKGSAFVNTKIFVKKQSFCFDCVKKTTMIFSWTVRNKDEAL